MEVGGGGGRWGLTGHNGDPSQSHRGAEGRGAPQGQGGLSLPPLLQHLPVRLSVCPSLLQTSPLLTHPSQRPSVFLSARASTITVHPPLCPSVRPPARLHPTRCLRLSVRHSSTYPSVCPSANPDTTHPLRPPVRPSIRLPIRLPVHPSIPHPPVRPSVHPPPPKPPPPSVCPSIPSPSVCPSVRSPYLCLPTRASVCPSVPPFILSPFTCLSVRPSFLPDPSCAPATSMGTGPGEEEEEKEEEEGGTGQNEAGRKRKEGMNGR